MAASANAAAGFQVDVERCCIATVLPAERTATPSQKTPLIASARVVNGDHGRTSIEGPLAVA